MRDYSKKSEIEQRLYDGVVEDLKHMVRPSWIDLPLKVMRNPKNRLMILKGPAGTGKDVGADFITSELGAVGMHQQWDVGIERQDVTATTGINTTPTEEDMSPYKVIQGILNKCAENGWVAIIDEANMALPGVTTLLNGFTDGSRYFMEYDRVVPIHPNFFIILTMNPGYRGTYPFNPSTLTRSALTLDIKAPGVDVEYQWLISSTDDYPTEHKIKPSEFPIEAWKEIFLISSSFYDYAAKYADNIDVTYRQRRRIVDLILFDPYNVKNVEQAFTNVLFNTIGVNEDDEGRAESFANSISTKTRYKRIVAAIAAKFDDKTKEATTDVPEVITKAKVERITKGELVAKGVSEELYEDVKEMISDLKSDILKIYPSVLEEE